MSDTITQERDTETTLNVALGALVRNVFQELPDDLSLALTVLRGSVMAVCSQTCCKDHALAVFDLFVEKLKEHRDEVAEEMSDACEAKEEVAA